MKLKVFSSTISTIVKLKGVVTRLGLHDFFTAISNLIVHVVIWSLMKRSTIEELWIIFCTGCHNLLIF
jgi:hypothetical protein